MSKIKQHTRSYRKRGEWQKLIDKWHASGMSTQVFCSKHGIKHANFCQWRSRLSREDPEPDSNTPSFVDLSSLSDSTTSHWQIILKLGEGVELQLSRF